MRIKYFDDSRNRRWASGIMFDVMGVAILILAENILFMVAGFIVMAFGALMMYFSWD
jgi:hypothetical protein